MHAISENEFFWNSLEDQFPDWKKELEMTPQRARKRKVFAFAKRIFKDFQFQDNKCLEVFLPSHFYRANVTHFYHSYILKPDRNDLAKSIFFEKNLGFSFCIFFQRETAILHIGLHLLLKVRLFDELFEVIQSEIGEERDKLVHTYALCELLKSFEIEKACKFLNFIQDQEIKEVVLLRTALLCEKEQAKAVDEFVEKAITWEMKFENHFFDKQSKLKEWIGFLERMEIRKNERFSCFLILMAATSTSSKRHFEAIKTNYS